MIVAETAIVVPGTEAGAIGGERHPRSLPLNHEPMSLALTKVLLLLV